MRILFLLCNLILLISTTAVAKSVDCALYSSSCETCFSYQNCMWCSIGGNGQCVTYFHDNVCENDMKCPSKQDETKYNTLLTLINSLKTKQNHAIPQEKKVFSDDTASTVELKELLHKLLLLKLLRKVKNEGSDSLTDEDRQILSEYSSNLLPKPTTTTTTTTTTTPESSFTNNKNMNEQLAKILSLLKLETKEKAQEVLSKIINPTTEILLTKSKSSIKIINRTNSTDKQVVNGIESGKVNYEEMTDQSIFEINQLLQSTAKIQTYEDVNATLSTKTLGTSVSTKKPATSTVHVLSYCHVYQQADFCNNDNNCTWCNTRDKCIARIDVEYKDCAANKKLDDQFGLDECLKFKRCKTCVVDPKCYWCGASKSCHSYPFFGFIPESCASEFFVKQCDVQLAVVIIVLPLIIILLAMVTFYFCLKYCYYRRKVLRVPLFERPGVFDYRKDKKVYFVNPEDEDDSADEMQVEHLRKKYRISADKAPLIDPNS